MAQFAASWGEAMRVEPGEYLALPFPAGGEIYRIEAAAFANTYCRTTPRASTRCGNNARADTMIDTRAKRSR